MNLPPFSSKKIIAIQKQNGDGSAQQRGSSRFLKKAAQKFLLIWSMGVVADTAHGPN
jgi:predicted RNA binding protein YcfA (HicA-like mRNA interferase family)